MVTPIKPGTARRLSLRRPQPRPAGLLSIDGSHLTLAEIEEIEQRWRAAVREQWHATKVVTLSHYDAPSLSVHVAQRHRR